MAARKRTTRTPKRSTKRSARSSGKSSGSSTPMLALAAILGLGAFSLWATSQHKSPQAAITALFQRPASKPNTQSSARTEPKATVTSKAPESKAPENKAWSKDYGAAVGPVPRPSAPVMAPAPQKPVQQAAIQTATPPRPTNQVVVSPPAAALRSMPPRGVNTPASSPSVIYAKARLTIHKNAWDKSPSIGVVEKGREMRSYGKTGRWHRVIVPKTNMIGWVHEDQLIGGRNKPDSASLITGPVTRKTQTATAAAPKQAPNPAHSRMEPPKAIGQKN
ncbi:hypothetical protein [Brucella anthropi]|uniref:hypothetical protein n=1 Tax=Brucella anthropi TaxID=529 RepID=UPI000F6795CA|nr:hypothetical protein [Brucella anthropi]MDH0367002.1 hypothetical protein [Brucella anthropi]RRY18167.1 hypothetical protein EGJ57_15230 [Brucella anthropi]